VIEYIFSVSQYGEPLLRSKSDPEQAMKCDLMGAFQAKFRTLKLRVINDPSKGGSFFNLIQNLLKQILNLSLPLNPL
jgi:hypothetical protein